MKAKFLVLVLALLLAAMLTGCATKGQLKARDAEIASLKQQLEEVRSLLGTKGASMSLSELIAAMANLSIETLKSKKFGKKRTHAASLTPTSELKNSTYVRHIPRAIAHEVWERDKGKCVLCGSRRNLAYDHIKPVALGGESSAENLRLLCFNCNQRRAIKTFGAREITPTSEFRCQKV